MSLTPGAHPTATGAGCDPGATVALDVLGQQAGTTTADASGAFSKALDLPDLAVGRYALVARCGPVLTTTFDVVITSQVDPGTTTVGILMLLFLLAGATIRRQMA